MAQGEPEADDIVENVGDYKVAMGKEIASAFKDFKIDFTNSWLRKGFVVYANGRRGGC